MYTYTATEGENMDIKKLIEWHTNRATATGYRLSESAEVRLYRMKMERQARFDASPVWRRGL